MALGEPLHVGATQGTMTSPRGSADHRDHHRSYAFDSDERMDT